MNKNENDVRVWIFVGGKPKIPLEDFLMIIQTIVFIVIALAIAWSVWG